MFDDDEWSQIIYKLIDLTRAEKVTWEIQFDGTLSSRVGSTTYGIGSVDEDGRAPYYFAVAQGEPAAEVTRLETGDESEHQRSLDNAVGELQRVAFRMASGGPQLAKQLLSQMEEILPTPAQNEPWGNSETPF